jgi:heterodisulfide reductase subunit A-like polyferredoxin
MTYGPDTVTMAVARARHLAPQQEMQVPVSHAALVIGGGISGMTAALEAANAGQQVVLVEREPRLGGFASRLYKKIPAGDFSNKPLIVDTDIENPFTRMLMQQYGVFMKPSMVVHEKLYSGFRGKEELERIIYGE